jgi:hypothetical protein
VGVGEVILPPDDVGDAHLDVVAHDHVVVEGAAVRAEEGEVLDVLEGPLLGSVHLVLEARAPLPLRHPEPDGEGLAPLGPADRLGLGQLPARLVAQPGLARRGQGLALGLQLVGGEERAVGPALAEQALRHQAVALHALALEVRPLIPAEAQPLEALQDAPGVRVRGPLLVGVLDAEHEGAPVLAGP